MSLSSEVLARYSEAYLISITNPQDRVATTVNQDTLDKAVMDVEADFIIHAQQIFDENNNLHLSTGVKGVIAYLLERSNQNRDSQSRLSAYRDQLIALSKVTVRNRVRPVTTIPDESLNAVFDRRRSRDLRLNNPPLGGDIE